MSQIINQTDEYNTVTENILRSGGYNGRKQAYQSNGLYPSFFRRERLYAFRARNRCKLFDQIHRHGAQLSGTPAGKRLFKQSR